MQSTYSRELLSQLTKHLLSHGNALLQQAANSGTARAATAIEFLKPKLKVHFLAQLHCTALHVLSMHCGESKPEIVACRGRPITSFPLASRPVRPAELKTVRKSKGD
jgi:predicted component of type VI protein secretion system